MSRNKGGRRSIHNTMKGSYPTNVKSSEGSTQRPRFKVLPYRFPSSRHRPFMFCTLIRVRSNERTSTLQLFMRSFRSRTLYTSSFNSPVQGSLGDWSDVWTSFLTSVPFKCDKRRPSSDRISQGHTHRTLVRHSTPGQSCLGRTKRLSKIKRKKRKSRLFKGIGKLHRHTEKDQHTVLERKSTWFLVSRRCKTTGL